MKTAVEILEEQLYEWLDGRIYLPPAFFEQAKEMEKEQIIDSINKYAPDWIDAEKYYNETFKTN
jgi:hypothetical protein